MQYYQMEDLGWYYSTMSFNFNDLVEPVPDSIYNQQPRCAESSLAYYDEGLGEEDGPFTCPRIGPYAPVIAVPEEVRQLDPAWKSCTAWYGGLYDPPKALQPVETAAGVSLQPAGHSSTASPGQTVSSSGATRTATTQQSALTPSPTSSSNEVASPTQSSAESDLDPSTTVHSSSRADSAPVDPTSNESGSLQDTSSMPANVLQPSGEASSFAKPTQAGDPVASSGATTNSSPDPADPSIAEQAGSSSKAADPLISAIGHLATSSYSAQDTQPTAGRASNTETADDSGFNADPLVSAIGQVAASTNAAAVTQPASTGQSTADDSQDPSDPDDTPQTAASLVAATIGSNGAIVTASAVGKSVAIAISGSSTILVTGQSATLAGHYVSVASDGIEIDSSITMALPAAPLASNAGADAQSPGIILTGSDGQSISVSQMGVSMVVKGPSSTVTLSPGQAALVAGQEVSAALSGGGLVIDGSRTTQLAPSSSTPVEGAVITGAQGQTIHISGVSGNVQLVDGSSTATLKAGETTVWDGRAISAVQCGAYAVVDGSSTIAVGAAGSSDSFLEATITGSQGQSVQLSVNEGGKLVAGDGTSSITLQAGQVTTFDGKTLSAAQPASYVVVDGSSTVSMHSIEGISTKSGTTITGAQGQEMQVFGENGEVEIADSSGTVTLNDGQVTIIDGRTFSAGPTGGYAVVDGSTTINLAPSSTSIASSPASVTGSQTSATLIIGSPSTDGKTSSSASCTNFSIWTCLVAFAAVVLMLP